VDEAGIWTIIGDRINPGFKATKGIVEEHDLSGLQELAVRQVETGADALDFTLGPDARHDPRFLTDAIRAVQEAVDVPLCFDYPESETQRICLGVYDPSKAKGRKPIINSIAETRWEMVELLKIQPCTVMIMASERLEDGIGAQNLTAEQIAGTAKRAALRLASEHGLAMDDIIIDISISAIITDSGARNRAALDAIASIGADPALKGIHVSGGITNIVSLLPLKAADGSDLKSQVECAFLTIARPLGMDTVLGTPWRHFHLLPEDNFVLGVMREILAASGSDVLRKVRKLYTPQRVGVA
jgi:cobalamin-dependent methionine synthase I